MADDDYWDDDEDEEEEEIEYVLFQGATNNADVDLSENVKLTRVALEPAKEMVTDALLRRADRIRLEPKGPRAAITLYIDGVPYPGGRMPSKNAVAITQMIKLLSGLDINDRASKQSSGMNAQLEDDKYVLLVRVEPIKGGGERLLITVRNTKEAAERESPQDLGFSDEMRKEIRERTGNKRGLLLTAGPPFSGLTTTTIGVVRSVDSFIYSVYTIADMEGRDITNVNPAEVRDGDTLETISDRLKRSDGDVLLIDPIRSAERAAEVFAECEKLCFVAEVPARDAAYGLAQMMAWTSPAEVAEKVEVVVGQKLIRALCPKCREAYRPHPKLVARLGLPPEAKLLYRPPLPPEDEEDEEEPCNTCNDLGYLGRVGMFEMIIMTDEMKQFLQTKPSPVEIKNKAKALNMPTLQKEGLRLVAEGKTSLEELQRAFKAK